MSSTRTQRARQGGWLIASFVALLLFVMPALAHAEIAPHVADEKDDDTCAMCHRSHTSASGVPWSDSMGTRHNALVVGVTPEDFGDTLLCYSCHGVDSLGSVMEVQSAFLSGSGHLIAPDTSAYGPSPKQCSTCHDSHGSAKVSTDVPYPALLRRVDASASVMVYQGADYCATCHSDRPADRWDGLDVWQQSPHSAIPAPATGSQIVCSSCHDPHGSPNAPTIVTELKFPAVDTTISVPGNDRRFCHSCHDVAQDTWPGPSGYATSSHALSTETVLALGEWPSRTPSGETTRAVGECQNCHAPMGRSDGDGGVVRELLEVDGRALCYACHDSNGPASTDMAALGFRGGQILEVVAGFGGVPDTIDYGRVHLLTRAATSTPDLVGPREYLPEGNVGPIASGDIDGDGITELVVARTDAPAIKVLEVSPFRGLDIDLGDIGLLAIADYLEVADVIDDAAVLPEVVAVDAASGIVRVYRWDGIGLAPVAAMPTVGTTSGLAVGNVTGTSSSDIVVTSNGPDRLSVIAGGSSLATPTPQVTRALPRGPSVGDLDGDGVGEIAVANSGETSGTASVFSGSGVEEHAFGQATDASATVTLIANVLPGVTPAGTSGNEIAVALASATTDVARLEAYPHLTTSIGTPSSHDLPKYSNPSDLAAGDVDADTRDEVVVGLSGTFSRSPQTARSPAIEIVRATAAGTALDGSENFPGGGVERAGSASVVVADLGSVGPSRHPVGAGDASHASTETAVVPKHVECFDCHNAHAANADEATAPAPPGEITRTPGVAVRNLSSTELELTGKPAIDYEYELCLKCHSTWSELDGSRSIAAEVTTLGASFHPVEGPSPSNNSTGALAAGLESGSLVFCTDCHGNAEATEPAGPHRSSSAPLLARPLAGALADEMGLLCYACHRYDVYSTGSADGQTTSTSGFYDADLVDGGALHARHTEGGFSCASCHVSHGSTTLPYLLRGNLGWSAAATGGSCTTSCHTGGAAHPYARP